MVRASYCCLLLLLAPAVGAHGLQLFADRDGDRLVGYAYYPGGGRARQVTIRIQDATGRVAATLTADDQGAFTWPAPDAAGYTVVAESADGHRATFPIASGSAALPPAVPHGDRALGELDAQALEALVAKAVASQVRPLREQLQQAESRRRLIDIVAGLGYIFGIMGVILFFRAARRRTTPPAPD